MKYGVGELLDNKYGKALKKLFPFLFLPAGCGGPANEYSLKADLNGDGHTDRITATGSLLFSEYPVTAEISGPDGRLGPPKEIGRFNEKLRDIKTESRGDTVDVVIVTESGEYKGAYKTHSFRNDGNGNLKGGVKMTVTLPEIESR